MQPSGLPTRFLNCQSDLEGHQEAAYRCDPNFGRSRDGLSNPHVRRILLVSQTAKAIRAEMVRELPPRGEGPDPLVRLDTLAKGSRAASSKTWNARPRECYPCRKAVISSRARIQTSTFRPNSWHTQGPDARSSADLHVHPRSVRCLRAGAFCQGNLLAASQLFSSLRSDPTG